MCKCADRFGCVNRSAKYKFTQKMLKILDFKPVAGSVSVTFKKLKTVCGHKSKKSAY
jgi:hypothetical protein